MNKRTGTLFLIPLTLLTLAFSSSPTSSSPGDELIGIWDGAVFVKGNPIGVDLEITQVKVNVNGGVFHYGEPRACRLNTAFITADGERYWFALKESTGGYCDKLEGKRLLLAPQPDERSLTYEIDTRSSGGENESATLNKR
jgi:hypothetical protein